VKDGDSSSILHGIFRALEQCLYRTADLKHLKTSATTRR